MEENNNLNIIATQRKTQTDSVVQMTVIGVGGGGCNMVDHMISQGIDNIKLIATNTDLQALRFSKAQIKIQLGFELTRGLGAGMKPEVGRDSAVESYNEIKKALEDSDIVFIAAGLGGGTGTGAASIVAKAASEIGALTVTVATKPFSWEGKRRMGLANLGLEELKKVCDSIIVVPNDRIFKTIDKNTSINDSFAHVDNVLYQAVYGMSEVILNPGKGINTDFADVKNVMQYRGKALIGIGRGKGNDAAITALENAIKSPLLDEYLLTSARGLLVHWTINPNISMFAISDLMEEITKNLGENVDIIFGNTIDEDLATDEVKITIVATGFDFDNDSSSKNEQQEKTKNILSSNELKNDNSIYDTPPLMRNYQIKFTLS